MLLNSYGHPESYFTDTLLQIAPNTKKNISSQQEGVDGIDEFPHHLIFQLIPGDSITVIFDDSISVVHYPESITNAYIDLLDTNGLLYSESRNLYHANSYFRKKVGDDFFRGTYTLSQEDLDYAIEINE